MAECLEAAGGTKCMVVKEGALAEIPTILTKYFIDGDKSGCSVFLAADTNTLRAAGNTVLETLQAAGIDTAGEHIFDEHIHAEYAHVETLTNKLKEALEKSKHHNKNSDPSQSDPFVLVPLAVGSGTINDLVKRAASELGLPYFCVPTAASVDGYTAYGAALLYEGFKQTLSCEAPLAVAADSAVLAAAPAYLSSSGFGDLAGKVISGSDWIIADKVFTLDGTGELAPGSAAIEKTAWTMVQNPLQNNLAQSVTAARGDKEAVGILFEALGISGFAMQYMKDSRAASGSEHMWSHVWEMENLSVEGVPVTHGHKVAMGTLAASAFTECLFKEKPPLHTNVPSWTEREAAAYRAFAGLDRALPSVLTTIKDKFIDDQSRLIKLREGILDTWDTLRSAVFEQLPPYAELYNLLREAGCPVKPETIGLSRERIIASSIKAQMIRKRFTVLDLAFETGVFDSVLKRMEASNYLS